MKISLALLAGFALGLLARRSLRKSASRSKRRYISHHEIDELAYRLWQHRGGEHSTAQQRNDDWARAVDLLESFGSG